MIWGPLRTVPSLPDTHVDATKKVGSIDEKDVDVSDKLLSFSSIDPCFFVSLLCVSFFSNSFKKLQLLSHYVVRNVVVAQELVFLVRIGEGCEGTRPLRLSSRLCEWVPKGVSLYCI